MHRMTVGYVCLEFMKVVTYGGRGEGGGGCKVHKAVSILHDKYEKSNTDKQYM